MKRLLLASLLVAGCPGEQADGVGYGQACDAQDDCRTGLVCGADATCHEPGEPGTGELGDACVGTVQCLLGLACASDGTCHADGDPGTTAFGEACTDDADCQAGLSCPDGTCRGLQMGLWAGAECADPDEETGPFRVYFEVPRGEPLADFYRLPFPNDARVDEDRIDLSGHPSPGALVDVVGDVVGNVLRLASTDTDGGFGANPAIFFRLTAFPDAPTLSFGLPGQGTLSLVDLDGADPAATHPIGYVVHSGRTPYLCENWLALYPVDGRPLEPGHTYAAMLTRGILDEQGHAAAQDADFAAVLAASEPAEAALLPAWEAYRPLRAWLAAQAVDPGDLAAAAVFTVQDTSRRPRLVHEAVQAAPLPELEGVVACGGGADPYAVPGDDSRGCTPADDRWTEVQATVPLPQFQRGQPPFKDFTDGGAIEVKFGAVEPDHFEDVHVSLAIPKGVPMPEGGWPVVLYAHGTGGSYTSHLRDGFADRFARASDGEAEVAFAILGFDAPLHGPRAHPEAWKQAWLDVDPDAYDPDVLFFNPLNLRAARDTAIQEAADAWSLVRLLAALELPADTSPTGEAVRFDVEHLVYAGHSQGGVVGALFAAWEPEVDAVVLSGAGGLTLRSILEKTSPHPLLPAVRVALADPDVDRVHPVLSLAQQLADAADGVNHGRYVLRRPPEGATGRHVLQVFGVGDTYAPDSTQLALAKALGLLQAPQGQSPLDAVSTVDLPTAGTNAGGRTGVVVLYPKPGAADAHFVLFEDDTAAAQVATFLATLVTDGTPTVPAP
jgi:hypothetical protein